MKIISRNAYADMYGPTTGDKIRLADTELFIEVEKDLTTYGEEVKLGGASEGEILEVNQVCAYFCYSNRTINGLGVSLEGDIVGYYQKK